ncbi:uncharacterized protein LDX57_012660 [Aspergillus melleus]|uniref:uncharacterized protein n=1 Tax=Aspergillus melleus TaxID=138277 RepID=UPI001E8E0DBF|nr:uncharacterized protein LDX57_012660 [Aspergillus melleus]KAH8435031.1 hypothetical protein LDX57_012660 [Aspergillus melleus]
MEQPGQLQFESPRRSSITDEENVESASIVDKAERDAQEELAALSQEFERVRAFRAELDQLGWRLSHEMERLSARLKVEEDTDSHKDTDSTSTEESERICFAELNYVPPSKMRKEREVPEKYYAIDIVSDNAISYQPKHGQGKQLEKAYAVLDEEPVHPDATDKTHWIPDRVVLNSERLKVRVDFDLWDGSLSWSSWEAYHILSPFKILVYLDQPIRERLREFERLFATMQPPSNGVKMETLQQDRWLEKRRQDAKDMSYIDLLSCINDFRCLVQFMDEHIEPVKTRLQSDNPGPVRFTDLWYAFPPGTLVYVKDKNIPQKVWKVVQRTGGRRYLTRPDHIPNGEFRNLYSQFVLDCFYLDYDGIRYVPIFRQFKLNDFEGSQAITSLPVYPFQTSETAKSKSDLLDRAHQFIQCTRMTHRYYSGRTHSRTPDGEKLADVPLGKPRSVSVYSEMVDSAVVVDFERAFQEVPAWRPGGNEPELYQMSSAELDSYMYAMDRDSIWDARSSEDFLASEGRKWFRWGKTGEPPRDEDDLLILPDRVFAYVLRTRKWACLQLGHNAAGQEQLRVVPPRQEPWNHLELPEGHKDIVQSLIDAHFGVDSSRNIHFDLVREKGKGVIILLHGVPGVGKTSTAECAAESNGRPLLPITCGDLGLSAEEVEDKLMEAFQLAQAWGCVMLLDEADVFLARREPADTQRNALVSVFLRVLEYYEGILFLTTNRVGTFDEAFKSRINVSLYYPPLTWYQTKRIWTSHINTATADDTIFSANTESLIKYAWQLYDIQLTQKQFGPIWNGRQIRNAFRTAVALASFRALPGQPVQLSEAHFAKVALVSNQFNDYIWRVKKSLTDSDVAKIKSIRVDDYVPGETLHVIQPQQNQPITNVQGGQLSPGIPRGFTPVPQSSAPAIPQFNAQAQTMPFNPSSQGHPQQLSYGSGSTPSTYMGYGVPTPLQSPQQNVQYQQLQGQQGMQTQPHQSPPQQNMQYQQVQNQHGIQTQSHQSMQYQQVQGQNGMQTQPQQNMQYQQFQGQQGTPSQPHQNPPQQYNPGPNQSPP